MTAPQIPLFSTPLANPATQDQAAFQEAAGRNFLETNTVFAGANVALAWQAGQTALTFAASSSAGSAAAAAGVSAAAAAATSTAPNWVSGATYAAGARARSLIDGLAYVRQAAGAGTTDPRNDSINWVVDILEIDTGLPALRPSLLLDFANARAADPRLVNALSNAPKTVTNARGEVVSVPAGGLRFQHDPISGECLGVLSEESYTNAFPNSENFTAWSTISASVSGGTVTESANNGIIRMQLASAPTVASGETIVVWFDMSRANTDWVRLRVVDDNNAGANFVDAWFNLATGQPGNLGVSNGLLTAVKHGVRPRRGGVWRCWLTVQTTGSVAANVRLQTASGNGAPVNRADVGSGPGIGSAYTLHRAQMQLNSPEVDPLNYVLTTSAAVTAPTDQIRMSGANFSEWFNSDRGTFLWVGRARVPPSGAAVGFQIHSGAATPRLGVEFTSVRSRVVYASGTTLSGPVVPDGQLMAMAVTYRPGYIALASGSTFAEAFDFSLATAPTILDIGGLISTDSTRLNRPIAQLAYYPADVTTAQLIALGRI